MTSERVATRRVPLRTSGRSTSSPASARARCEARQRARRRGGLGRVRPARKKDDWRLARWIRASTVRVRHPFANDVPFADGAIARRTASIVAAAWIGLRFRSGGGHRSLRPTGLSRSVAFLDAGNRSTDTMPRSQRTPVGSLPSPVRNGGVVVAGRCAPVSRPAPRPTPRLLLATGRPLGGGRSRAPRPFRAAASGSAASPRLCSVCPSRGLAIGGRCPPIHVHTTTCPRISSRIIRGNESGKTCRGSNVRSCLNPRSRDDSRFVVAAVGGEMRPP